MPLTRGGTVNLTLLIASACLASWIGLAFIAGVPSGAVHLFYAAGIVLLARRVLVGAPRFLS
jgi:hypothetical protein